MSLLSGSLHIGGVPSSISLLANLRSCFAVAALSFLRCSGLSEAIAPVMAAALRKTTRPSDMIIKTKEADMKSAEKGRSPLVQTSTEICL